MKRIDRNLKELFEYIKNFINEKKYPPSVREMANFLDIKSTSTIHYYLNKLEEYNLIKRDVNKNRAIEIVNDLNNLENNLNYNIIPLVGTIAAGEPILATENIEDVFSFNKSFFPMEDLFMLTIKGESMINAGILNGDKIIVKKQNTANNGDIVVAMIDGNVTTKRFFKENGTIRLQPENDTMEPIFSNMVSILGIVVGLVRKY